MHKIGIVFAFQWYAMFIYWQFVATSIGESAFNTNPEQPRFQEAVGWVGAMNGTYNFVTIFAALGLIAVAARFGAKWIHAAALAGAAIGLIALSQIGNQYLALAPMILLGIAWASMMGIPYILVASMVPRERTGVYMGIVNMMIVVPMLIETLTFGWIFENLLGSSGPNAIMFAGVLDRKSTRLNSSHANISYAVFCLKKHTITRGKAYNTLPSPSTRISPNSESAVCTLTSPPALSASALVVASASVVVVSSAALVSAG